MFRLILTVGVAGLLAACMQPEGPTGGPIDTKKSTIAEPDRMAGATSSTNWPSEDAGRSRAVVVAEFDSVLGLAFKDTDLVAITITGSITIYRSGTIPALEPPESTQVNLSAQTGFRLNASTIFGNSIPQLDTVPFAMLLRNDSLQCLMTGLAYVPSSGKFFAMVNPQLRQFHFPVSVPKYGIKAVPGQFLPKTRISASGQDGWCLYIPGTPFFYRIPSSDTLLVAPIPSGNFPFRLLTLTPDPTNPNLQTLAIYEAKSDDIGQMGSRGSRLEAVEKIAEVSTKSSITIRF